MFGEPAHTVVLPEITVGNIGVGVTVTLSVCAIDAPHALFAITDTFPLVKLEVVVSVFVVDVPVHPLGVLQVYEVAVLTGVTLYVFVEPEHIAALPLIVPGCGAS